jgi:hypothetical protein
VKHLLMDPAFPNIVGAWAAHEAAAADLVLTGANDNGQELERWELSDPLLAVAARMEIEATRIW